MKKSVNFTKFMSKGNINSVGGGGVPRKKIFHGGFGEVASLENLFLAWREFRRGKRKKRDVQEFEFNLEDNIFRLHEDLVGDNYKHSPYESFCIQDPKLRHIHKAVVHDRVVHQALFRKLYPIFDKSFIQDSYSCRINKGTHRAVRRLVKFSRKLSRNYTRDIFILKCDVKKFFDSVDHAVLMKLILEKIKNEKILQLIREVIASFEKSLGKGLPIGNVTSQIFANIYLNELDKFIKHKLGIKYYIRYCDDFVILSDSREKLEGLITKIAAFLCWRLKLQLHEKKVIIRKFSLGVDFLGYIILPCYLVLRTKTKTRMIKKLLQKKQLLNAGAIDEAKFNQSLQSYFGILTHCNGYKIRKNIEKDILLLNAGHQAPS